MLGGPLDATMLLVQAHVRARTIFLVHRQTRNFSLRQVQNHLSELNVEFEERGGDLFALLGDARESRGGASWSVHLRRWAMKSGKSYGCVEWFVVRDVEGAGTVDW